MNTDTGISFIYHDVSDFPAESTISVTGQVSDKQ